MSLTYKELSALHRALPDWMRKQEKRDSSIHYSKAAQRSRRKKAQVINEK